MLAQPAREFIPIFWHRDTQNNSYLMTKYILPVQIFTCGKRNDGISFWKAYDMVDEKQLNSYSRRKFISMKNNFV